MDLKSRLWMLSGPRGAGKTTFCRNLTAQARVAGWGIAGLLSPAVFEGNTKTGIRVEDLRTGKQRLLASASPIQNFDLRLGEWYFDHASIDWGNNILESSLPCDLLIVDEIGPLELSHGKGWSSALRILKRPAYRIGVVVVRPEQQAAVSVLLSIHEKIILEGSSTKNGNAQAWWDRMVKETSV